MDGFPIVTTTWAQPDGSGDPAADVIGLHRLGSRQDSGLGITACGLAQHDRSEPWAYLDPENAHQVGVLSEVDPCPTCYPDWPNIQVTR